MKKIVVVIVSLLALVGLSDDYSINVGITYSEPFSYVRIGATTSNTADPWKNGIYVGYGNIELGYVGVTSKATGSDSYWTGDIPVTSSIESYDSGYWFYVELVGADNYSKLAYSGLVDYDTLTEYISDGQFTAGSWILPKSSLTPVPEPTSGLLLLVGGALLGLRRKRRVA